MSSCEQHLKDKNIFLSSFILFQHIGRKKKKLLSRTEIYFLSLRCCSHLPLIAYSDSITVSSMDKIRKGFAEVFTNLVKYISENNFNTFKL